MKSWNLYLYRFKVKTAAIIPCTICRCCCVEKHMPLILPDIIFSVHIQLILHQILAHSWELALYVQLVLLQNFDVFVAEELGKMKVSLFCEHTCEASPAIVNIDLVNMHRKIYCILLTYRSQILGQVLNKDMPFCISESILCEVKYTLLSMLLNSERDGYVVYNLDSSVSQCLLILNNLWD